MWESIRYITSGLTLVAFIVAVTSIVIKEALKNKKNLIETAPPEDRAPLVEKALEQYHIETTALTKQQKYNIIMEQIRSRAKKQKQYFRIGIFAFGILALIAVYAIREANDSTLEQVTISGVVEDSSCNAIVGALVTVEAYDFIAETRSSGVFRGNLYNVTKGDSILINIMHEDYFPEPVNVTIRDSSIELHTIRLRKIEH